MFATEPLAAEVPRVPGVHTACASALGLTASPSGGVEDAVWQENEQLRSLQASTASQLASISEAHAHLLQQLQQTSLEHQFE